MHREPFTLPIIFEFTASYRCNRKSGFDIPFFSTQHILVETFRRFALAQLGVSLAWCAAANVSTTKNEKGVVRAIWYKSV
jgi:hypothetical protein